MEPTTEISHHHHETKTKKAREAPSIHTEYSESMLDAMAHALNPGTPEEEVDKIPEVEANLVSWLAKATQGDPISKTSTQTNRRERAQPALLLPGLTTVSSGS